MTGVENIIMHIHLVLYTYTVCTHAHGLHVHDAYVQYYCITRYDCCSDSQLYMQVHLYAYLFANLNRFHIKFSTIIYFFQH